MDSVSSRQDAIKTYERVDSQRARGEVVVEVQEKLLFGTKYKLLKDKLVFTNSKQ